MIPVARLIAEDKLTETIYTSPLGPISPLDILHGHGAAIEQGNEFMAHKTGFTPKSFNAALLDAGFKSIGMVARDERSMGIWAVATKKLVNDKDEMVGLVKQHVPLKSNSEF